MTMNNSGYYLSALLLQQQPEPSNFSAPPEAIPVNPDAVPTDNGAWNSWLEAFGIINKNAADSAVQLAQNYPIGALILVVLFVYLSTSIKVRGVSPLELLLTVVFQIAKQVIDGIREFFAFVSSALFRGAASINNFYTDTFKANMAFEAILVIFFTIVAVGAIFVNFSLIYRPLQGWFGVGIVITPIGPIPQAMLYSIIIILAELLIGYFLVHAWKGASEQKGESWSSVYTSPGVLISLVGVSAFAIIEGYLAFRREELIQLAQKTQEYLQSLDSGSPLQAAEDVVVGLPVYAQVLLGIIFPFVLAGTSIFIERCAAILMYLLAIGPAILFDVVERIFRVGIQVLDWIIIALKALVELLRAFLSVFFWPFEQLFKRMSGPSDDKI